MSRGVLNHPWVPGDERFDVRQVGSWGRRRGGTVRPAEGPRGGRAKTGTSPVLSAAASAKEGSKCPKKRGRLAFITVNGWVIRLSSSQIHTSLESCARIVRASGDAARCRDAGAGLSLAPKRRGGTKGPGSAGATAVVGVAANGVDRIGEGAVVPAENGGQRSQGSAPAKAAATS